MSWIKTVSVTIHFWSYWRRNYLESQITFSIFYYRLHVHMLMSFFSGVSILKASITLNWIRPPSLKLRSQYEFYFYYSSKVGNKPSLPIRKIHLPSNRTTSVIFVLLLLSWDFVSFLFIFTLYSYFCIPLITSTFFKSCLIVRNGYVVLCTL